MDQVAFWVDAIAGGFRPELKVDHIVDAVDLQFFRLARGSVVVVRFYSSLIRDCWRFGEVSVQVGNALAELFSGKSRHRDSGWAVPDPRRFAVEGSVNVGRYRGGIFSGAGISIFLGHGSADQLGQAAHAQVADQSMLVLILDALSGFSVAALAGLFVNLRSAFN